MCNITIHKAIQFASLAHKDQCRKGTNIPYIVHPFEVAQILTDAECQEEVIVAGLLHDTVEDTEVTLELIEQEFGQYVAELVNSSSEDKTKTWEERKQHTIDSLEECDDINILLLCCADKLANLRSIKADYDEIGDNLWKRFNRGKEKTAWYYSKLIDVFTKPLVDYNMYSELSHTFNCIFLNYFINSKKDTLVQVFYNESYVMKKSNPTWLIKKGELGKSYCPIDYKDAVALEDEWVGPKILTKYSNFELPFPDISVTKSSEKNEYGDVNISFHEGVFSDGRPFLAELWAAEGVTMVTVFMSSVGFKADEIAEMTADCKQFEDEVLSYLEEEGVVYYSKKSFTMGIFYDKSNHKLLSCNITVGVEDELYSEVSFPFWGLNHFDPVTDEF